MNYRFSDNNIFIYNDDKEFCTKCREIWNKITELIGINCPRYFVESNSDYDDELFIMADVHENRNFVLEDNHRYGQKKAVIVLHSVINDYLKTSLGQHRY